MEGEKNKIIFRLYGSICWYMIVVNNTTNGENVTLVLEVITKTRIKFAEDAEELVPLLETELNGPITEMIVNNPEDVINVLQNTTVPIA
eukprot:CAMPEP_0204821138 /NCGR_PEP_ID=MMETSP1018-20131115/3792_1 /ASSEMBLY_ACC=CAM_ASM_000518 /TAXON_ID=46462 /ORGANISM="Anophryoides haemophila, Strain AH6" /LENGTH=88 /DNA_ID=CAMNT_0051921043 /DNA_START=182 /DNA_END=445 /DNA_ORIENTATION=+